MEASTRRQVKHKLTSIRSKEMTELQTILFSYSPWGTRFFKGIGTSQDNRLQQNLQTQFTKEKEKTTCNKEITAGHRILHHSTTTCIQAKTIQKIFTQLHPKRRKKNPHPGRHGGHPLLKVKGQGRDGDLESHKGKKTQSLYSLERGCD